MATGLKWRNRQGMVRKMAEWLIYNWSSEVDEPCSYEEWYERHIGKYATFPFGNKVRDNQAGVAKAIFRDACKYAEDCWYDLREELGITQD